MYPDVPSFDRTKQPLTGATKARADARERKRARLRDEALDALGPAAEFVRSKAAAARGGAVGAIAARAAEKERKAAARAEMLANRPWEDKDDGDRKHLFVTFRAILTDRLRVNGERALTPMERGAAHDDVEVCGACHRRYEDVLRRGDAARRADAARGRRVLGRGEKPHVQVLFEETLAKQKSERNGPGGDMWAPLRRMEAKQREEQARKNARRRRASRKRREIAAAAAAASARRALAEGRPMPTEGARALADKVTIALRAHMARQKKTNPFLFFSQIGSSEWGAQTCTGPAQTLRPP